MGFNGRLVSAFPGECFNLQEYPFLLRVYVRFSTALNVLLNGESGRLGEHVRKQVFRIKCEQSSERQFSTETSPHTAV